MMSSEEQEAATHLILAKDELKRALQIVDPNVTEPFSQATLRALDAINSASQTLAERFPV